VAQRVGSGIALVLHDHGTRRVVCDQQHAPAALYHVKDPVPIVQESGWVPGPVWTGRKSRPHRDFFSYIYMTSLTLLCFVQCVGLYSSAKILDLS